MQTTNVIMTVVTVQAHTRVLGSNMMSAQLAGLFLLCGTILAQPANRQPVAPRAVTYIAKQITYALRSDITTSTAHELKVEQNKMLDADSVLVTLSTDRDVIRHDFDETAHLISSFKNDEKNLAAATDLENAIYNVLERTAFEGWLLEMYDHVTDPEALRDAERVLRKHYADLGTLIAVDVHAVQLVTRNCESKDLCALAAKTEGDIQKITDRYRVLGKE